MPRRVAAELHHVEARARPRCRPCGVLASRSSRCDTTWLVPQSGRCDQACGCVTRFMRTVIRFLSSAKIEGTPSQCLLGRGRHPVDAVGGEELDALLPALAGRAARPGGRGTARPRAACRAAVGACFGGGVADAGLRAGGAALAFASRRRWRLRLASSSPRAMLRLRAMNSAQALIWLRIGASVVPQRDSTTPPSRCPGRRGAGSSPSRRRRTPGPGGISRNSPGRRR